MKTQRRERWLPECLLGARHLRSRHFSNAFWGQHHHSQLQVSESQGPGRFSPWCQFTRLGVSELDSNPRTAWLENTCVLSSISILLPLFTTFVKRAGQGLLFPFYMALVVISLPMQETQETGLQSLGWEDTLEKEMQPTSVFLPGKIHGQRSPVGYGPWGWTQLSTEKYKTSCLTSHKQLISSRNK